LNNNNCDSTKYGVPEFIFYQALSRFHALDAMKPSLKGVFSPKTSMADYSIQQTPLKNCILASKPLFFIFLHENETELDKK